MIKTRFFTGITLSDLEEEVSAFVRELSSVPNISYTTCVSISGRMIYNVVILYKE